jgi:two-component system phosphate regulon response regulator OmpR
MADRAAAAPAAGRIVVVDDEPDLRAMLGDYLSLHGFAVGGAADAAALDALLLAEGPPDLLILDVNMPGEDGFALLRRLRAAGCRAGVVMLTAAAVDVPSRVAGLDGGADDYLAKPVELRELLARVRGVLRRVEAEPPPPAATPTRPRRHRFGRCTLDPEGRRLLDEAGEEVPLTAMEYDLLAALARHPRQVLSRDRLAGLAHDRPLAPGDRSVDIRVARLRQKLERDPASPTAIRTVRGEGYAYEPEG